MRRALGFTLLEMLVAISVFTVVGIASYTTLNNIQKSEAISRDKSEQMKTLQRAMTIIERDIIQATRRQVRIDEREASEGFLWAGEYLVESQFDGLVLTRQGWRNPTAMLPRSTLQSISYRVQENRLERLYFVYPDAVSGTEPKVSPVLEGINGFKVSIYDENGWQRPWEGKTIPKAISVELDIEGVGVVNRMFLLAGDGNAHRQVVTDQGGSGGSGGSGNGNEGSGDGSSGSGDRRAAGDGSN
ncbi:type II secretion system minor pseudopilin GspJ [Corallincola platygyrae]|uniref:Type II secretion system protein J n=1 Tax=Corallincola platygyrae TaxID=1193278 RepID=A0ABW4XQZ5_9GAMM